MLRPTSGKPIDRRHLYRMVLRIAKGAAIGHVGPHCRRHAAITTPSTPAFRCATPKILALTTTTAPPSTTNVPGNLDRLGTQFLKAYVAGVQRRSKVADGTR